MLFIISALFAAATTVAPDTSPNLIVIYLSAIGAFIVSVGTAAGFVWNIYFKGKKLKMDQAEHSTTVRSVTFDEMEAAIPGLGSLVDRWQKQAETAWTEIERLRASEEVDRAKISELETQVRALTAELLLEKKKNMQLEDRVSELEGRKK